MMSCMTPGQAMTNAPAPGGRAVRSTRPASAIRSGGAWNSSFWLLDADLAILGAEPQAYDGYSRGVRGEYSRLPDHLWRAGRRDVLNSLLGRGSIFVTAPAAGRWESAARANVQRELGALDG
jgi:predicted metal-dependent HD superfamily phosphohydrolase